MNNNPRLTKDYIHNLKSNPFHDNLNKTLEEGVETSFYNE